MVRTRQYIQFSFQIAKNEQLKGKDLLKEVGIKLKKKPERLTRVT